MIMFTFNNSNIHKHNLPVLYSYFIEFHYQDCLHLSVYITSKFSQHIILWHKFIEEINGLH